MARGTPNGTRLQGHVGHGKVTQPTCAEATTASRGASCRNPHGGAVTRTEGARATRLQTSPRRLFTRERYLSASLSPCCVSFHDKWKELSNPWDVKTHRVKTCYYSSPWNCHMSSTCGGLFLSLVYRGPSVYRQNCSIDAKAETTCFYTWNSNQLPSSPVKTHLIQYQYLLILPRDESLITVATLNFGKNNKLTQQEAHLNISTINSRRRGKPCVSRATVLHVQSRTPSCSKAAYGPSGRWVVDAQTHRFVIRLFTTSFHTAVTLLPTRVCCSECVYPCTSPCSLSLCQQGAPLLFSSLGAISAPAWRQSIFYSFRRTQLLYSLKVLGLLLVNSAFKLLELLPRMGFLAVALSLPVTPTPDPTSSSHGEPQRR